MALMADHRCSSCSGSFREELVRENEVDPFCPSCDYLMDLHTEAGVCPDEAEARERWGK